MKLFLVQHGEALTKEVDPERPLSGGGSADMQQMARYLHDGGVRVTRIGHSGKLRAKQTAEILGARLCSTGPPEMLAGLAPLDPVDELAAKVEHWSEDTLIAGHQPFMGRLASLLLGGTQGALRIAFVPGTVVCLERDVEGAWSLRSMRRPDGP